MNETGKFFISKYPDSRSRTFSKSTQPTLVRKGEEKMPGPGYYNYYSEFGVPNKVLWFPILIDIFANFIWFLE